MTASKPVKKGQKGKKSKKPTDQETRLNALVDARITNLKKLREEYIENAKLLLREPLVAMISALDLAITNRTDLTAIVLSKLTLFGSDLWATHNTFSAYEWLKTLSLSSIRLDDAKLLKPLCETIGAHPALDTLILVDCKLNSGSVGTLAKGLVHSNIQTLILDFNNIGDGWIQLLSTIKKRSGSPDLDSPCDLCQSQSRDGLIDNPIKNDVSAQPRHQRPHTKITHLSAKFTEIGVDSAVLISELIRANSSFRYLDVSGNSLGAQGVSIVCTAVSANVNMETFIAAANLIHVSKVLNPMIKDSPTLKNQYELKPEMNEDGRSRMTNEQWMLNMASQLAKILSDTQHKLSVIDFRHNEIGDSACLTLLQGMEQRKSLLMAKKYPNLPAVCLFISEQLPSLIFRKVLDLNSWMDAFQKKNKKGAGGSKKKKNSKKK